MHSIITANIENILNPLNNTLNQGMQYAQNTLINVKNDAVQLP